MQKNNDTKEIDLLKLFGILLSHLWIIILAALLLAIVGFGYATFFVTPTYRASTQIYVHNGAQITTTGKISSAELSATQLLVNDYLVILKTSRLLQKVVDDTGLDYSVDSLKRCITAESIQDTEIFNVYVTTEAPEDAKIIADSLGRNLDAQIQEIIPNTTTSVIEEAKVPSSRYAPSRVKYAMVGGVIGALISALILVIIDLSDDIIHNEEYLVQTYNLPILSVIPDLKDESASQSGKYGKSYGSGYGGYGKYGGYGAYGSYGSGKKEKPKSDADKESK